MMVSVVTGPLRTMKCPSSEPVSTMVPTPLFSVILESVVAQVAQHSAGVGQLGAAQVDLVVRHHADELKDLLPAGDEARARRVRKLLAQLQVVQNEPVAVVGNAQTVCGLAIGGGGKVGADPGGQPCASVRALGQQRPVLRAQRGVNPVEVAAPVRGQKAVGQADLVDGEPGVQGLSSKSLSEPATLLRLST